MMEIGQVGHLGYARTSFRSVWLLVWELTFLGSCKWISLIFQRCLMNGGVLRSEGIRDIFQ